MAPTAVQFDLVDDAQMTRFTDLIYRRTGIRIPQEKKTLISNRIRRRLRSTGIEGFDKYFGHLQALRPQDPEWDAFLQEVTTHETYLFRDESHWDWFRNNYLPEFAKEVRDSNRPKTLRIWSAACSTGDEIMTMASCIAACLPGRSEWKIQLLGTDIGIGALEQAKNAEFGERAMRLVPDDYKRRYFAKAPDADLWTAKPTLTGMTSFRQHNLMEPLKEQPFDLVILKNVLIYFDPVSKKKVIDNLRSVLRPGGYLLCGAAEGVSDLLREMERSQVWLFREPSRKPDRK